MSALEPKPESPIPPHPSFRRRPISVTVVSWIFITIGAVTLVLGLLPPWNRPRPSGHYHTALELALICGVRLTASVCGAFMLFGFNWARWLLAVWVAWHLGLSSLHSVFALIVHVVLFGVLMFLLFRPAASAYFRHR